MTVRRLLQASGHGGLDNAGFDHGDPDVKRLHLLGQCLAERLQGKLGGGVGANGEVAMRPATEVTLMMHPLCVGASAAPPHGCNAKPQSSWSPLPPGNRPKQVLRPIRYVPPQR